MVAFHVLKMAGCLGVVILIGGGPALAGQPAESAPGPRVLTDDGGWGYAGPHAVVGNDRLFVSYLDQSGTIWVASFDHATGDITRHAVWDGQSDLHSANPLCIRPDGRIQVFVDKGGYVDNRIYWKISTRPGDISEFGELQQSSIEADITQGRQFYPMVIESTDEIYVITNALRDDGVREAVMWRSRDGGDTFAEHTRLWSLAEGLSGNRSYTRAFVAGEDIHLVAVRVGWGEPLGGHEVGRSEGVYYVRFNTREQTFYHADGRHAFDLADAPVYDTRYFDTVWHWADDGQQRHRGLWADLVADRDGRPYVAYAVQRGVARGESALHQGYRAAPDEEGRWRSHRVATLARGWDNTPERKNYAIALDSEAPDTVYVARSTNADRDRSQVQRMRTTDGGETWESEAVLSGEGRITTVVVPRLIDAGEREIEALWLDGRMEGWRDFATRIMMRPRP